MHAPKVVVQIAQLGKQGAIELSDLIISSQGQQKGAILIEYNLPPMESHLGYGMSTLESAVLQAPASKLRSAKRLRKSILQRRILCRTASLPTCPYMSRNSELGCTWKTTGFGLPTTIWTTPVTTTLSSPFLLAGASLLKASAASCGCKFPFIHEGCRRPAFTKTQIAMAPL